MGHRFKPEHMQRLLSAEREQSLPPSWVWDHLRLGGCLDVADVGVGPGYFALPAAQRTTGTVYGIDIEPQMLAALKERALAEGKVNLVGLEGNADAIPLPDDAVDCTLCAFVLHEVDVLSRALAELRRITKENGVVGLLEWEKKETSYGPPVSERLDRDVLLAAAQAAGFSEIVVQVPNQDQYMLIARA